MYRSWLFVPGSKDKFLRKVNEVDADVIIYDLEDAVAETNKQEARTKVKETMNEASGKVNVVRVNALDTSFFMDDLQEVIGVNLDGIMLPKTNNRDDILIIDYVIGKLEEKQGLPSGSVSIIPIIESAEGLKNSYEIASASTRIACLAFGAEDYMLDLNLQPDGDEQELLYARSNLVVSSRAAGVDAPVDSIYTDFRDSVGLKGASERSIRAGFQGKLLIHPNQVEIVNDIFSPTQEQIDEAREIVELYNKSLEQGDGALQVNGKMIDVPIAERAKRVLMIAEKVT